MTVLNKKFLQTLDTDIYSILKVVAEGEEIPVRELVRAVVVPDWMLLVSGKTRRRARLASASQKQVREN